MHLSRRSRRLLSPGSSAPGSVTALSRSLLKPVSVLMVQADRCGQAGMQCVSASTHMSSQSLNMDAWDTRHNSETLFRFLYSRATQRNNTLAWAGDCVSARLIRSHHQVLRGGYRESWDVPTSQKKQENDTSNPQTQNTWDLHDALISTGICVL